MTRPIPEAVRESLTLLSVPELCEILNVKRDWVYDECSAGRLPHVRLGRKILFRPADIFDYVSAQMVVTD